MAEIVKSIDIAAPVETVFNYVADPRNALTYMANFSKFEPVGVPEVGLGAKVEASGSFMGMQIKTQLEIVEFIPNQRLVSRSIQGVKSYSIWQFKPLPDGGTEVTFVSDYTPPGSKLGRFLDKLVLEKDVEKNTIETLVNLKKVIEGKPNLRVVNSSAGNF
ncbi:MAG TPA: SRPBCC family protein [Chloroflexia bacterium]|nr:SRPBCC family protein [Chloroflexia bacterium]